MGARFNRSADPSQQGHLVTSAASGELALQVLLQRVTACERPRSPQKQVSSTPIEYTSQEVEESELTPKHNVVSNPKTEGIDGSSEIID